MYSFNAKVRYSECDSKGRMKLNYIMNYMQDCSTAQSEDLGVGLSFQEKESLGWFVTEYNLHILKRPVLGQMIRVSTLPYKLVGMFGYRCFMINDAATGELLAISDTLWVMMNMTDLSIIRIPQIYFDSYEILPKPEYDFGASRIRALDQSVLEESGKFEVSTAFIDNNHHMNNAWYPSLAEAALPEGFEYSKCVINYKKSAHLGDVVTLKLGELSEGFQVLMMLGEEVSAIVNYTK